MGRESWFPIVSIMGKPALFVRGAVITVANGVGLKQPFGDATS